MRRLAVVTILALVAVGGVASNTAQDPQPTCKNCPATYVSREELQEYREWGIASKTIDQQVRALDVGKLNVDVAMVYRGKLDKPAPESVAEHDQVSEVYHIIEGPRRSSPVPSWSARSGGRPPTTTSGC